MPFFDSSDQPMNPRARPGTPGQTSGVQAPSAGGMDLATHVNHLYRIYLGREANPQEIQTHLRNAGGNLETIAAALSRSPEAAAYRRTGGGATPTSTSPWATAPANGNWEAWFRQNIQSLPAGSQSLLSLEPQLRQHGIEVLRNAQGIAGKIRLPNGQIVDVGGNFSSGDPSRMSWQWLTGRGGAGGATGATGSLLEPWGETFEFRDFAAPTIEEARANPGFQHALQEGLKAIERSKAAAGTVLNPATAKALNEFANQAADVNFANVYAREASEYDRSYNQALQQYLERRDVFESNADRTFDKLYNFSNLGAQAASNAAAVASQYGSNLAGLLGQGANAQAAGGIGASNAWGGFLNNLGNQALSLYGQNRFLPRTRT
jgi:hypothetical protein